MRWDGARWGRAGFWFGRPQRPGWVSSLLDKTVNLPGSLLLAEVEGTIEAMHSEKLLLGMVGEMIHPTLVGLNRICIVPSDC